MSREFWLVARSRLDMNIESVSDIRYADACWIEDKIQYAERDEYGPAGQITLGCSYCSHGHLLEAIEEVGEGKVIITGEDDIFAPPEILKRAVLQNWDKWHEEDPRWGWSSNTIEEFFKLHQWAVIYISVY